jgi:hypothetical protein
VICEGTTAEGVEMSTPGRNLDFEFLPMRRLKQKEQGWPVQTCTAHIADDCLLRACQVHLVGNGCVAVLNFVVAVALL